MSEREQSYVDALREAALQEMERDPSVVCFGLDVDDPKAIQGTTRGLLEKFGPERVFGTPLAEDAMTGVAIGMALAGLRPIHVHIRMDFLLLAMNQLVNVAAKSHYMYGGHVSRAAGRALDDRQELGAGRPALAGALFVLHARAGPEGGGAHQSARRQGLSGRGDPRRQPGDDGRAPAALPAQGSRARGALRSEARSRARGRRREATSRSSASRTRSSSACGRARISRRRASRPK